jgi:hypothetical protein
MQPLAIVTMVYNEGRRLPYWLAHYDRQVGLENCYVIDHGSEDGSTEDLRGASRIRLPRSPQDNDRRLRLVADVVQGLLLYYRRVAYVDADELLLADPRTYTDLRDYAARMQADVVTSIGLELVQTPEDSPLQAGLGAGEQRGTAIFSSSMCKTNMIGTPVNWAPGWHSHNGKPRFDDLYLIHLRHADLDQALERLAVTRDMPWASEHAGKHQRVDDQWMRDVIRFFGSRPLAGSEALSDPQGPLRRELDSFVADSAASGDPARPWSVPLARYGNEAIPLPQAFREAISEKPV